MRWVLCTVAAVSVGGHGHVSKDTSQTKHSGAELKEFETLGQFLSLKEH